MVGCNSTQTTLFFAVSYFYHLTGMTDCIFRFRNPALTINNVKSLYMQNISKHTLLSVMRYHTGIADCPSVAHKNSSWELFHSYNSKEGKTGCGVICDFVAVFMNDRRGCHVMWRAWGIFQCSGVRAGLFCQAEVTYSFSWQCSNMGLVITYVPHSLFCGAGAKESEWQLKMEAKMMNLWLLKAIFYAP